MLDVTSTAAVVIGLTNAAAANGGNPVNPMTLAVLGGIAASHMIEPHTDGLSDKMKPVVAVAAPALASAVAAISQGTPWQGAVGYGLVTAISSIASHWTFFSSTGFSSFVGGIISAVSKKQ